MWEIGNNILLCKIKGIILIIKLDWDKWLDIVKMYRFPLEIDEMFADATILADKNIDIKRFCKTSDGILFYAQF